MRRNLFFSAILLYLFLGINAYGQSLIPELKKSINTYCKSTSDFGVFKNCKNKVYDLLLKQGTDFIYKVDESYREDFFVICNRYKGNAFEFNACLYKQVGKTLGEDTTIDPPVLIITEKDSNNDEITKVIEMPEETEINVIQKVINASFFVYAAVNADEGYSGAAVKINDYQLATACHVVYDEKKKSFYEDISVVHIKKDLHLADHWLSATVAKFDLSKDACILETKNISQYSNLSKRSFKDLKEYEKIYAVGNPNGFIGRTSEGRIQALFQNTPLALIGMMNNNKYNPGKLIETNAPLDTGNSGGGVYDKNGNLIGIVSACRYDNNNQECRNVNPINWTIPISSFENLADFKYN